MKRDVKVGLFLFAGLLLAGLVVFLIGDERKLFSSSATIEVKFQNAAGLKSGAPIRMAGIDIGHVSSVAHKPDPRDPYIYVALKITRESLGRIPKDSRASVAMKGLLGDKMIEVLPGSASEMVEEGGQIAGLEPEDMFGNVKEIAEEAKGTLRAVRKVGDRLNDKDLNENIQGSVKQMSALLKNVNEGEGYPHKFLTDKEEAERISKTLDNLQNLSGEITLTLKQARAVMGRVETGPGFAHDLIYGQGPKKEIAQIGALAEEITTSVKGIRQGNGIAKQVLYGGDGETKDLVTNLNSITNDMRVIVSNIRQGKGTVGALLVDPSVYEDVKTILGNVQRNDVLRALVRYSIKQDEKKPEVRVSDSKKQEEASKP